MISTSRAAALEWFYVNRLGINAGTNPVLPTNKPKTETNMEYLLVYLGAVLIFFISMTVADKMDRN